MEMSKVCSGTKWLVDVLCDTLLSVCFREQGYSFAGGWFIWEGLFSFARDT